MAYESDLAWVAKAMLDVTAEEIGSVMAERVRTFRELPSRTPVDALEVQERPVVFFRPHENTWVQAIVRYLGFRSRRPG